MFRKYNSYSDDERDYEYAATRDSTQSYDKMGPVGEDPRWEVFGPFHAYLAKSFPLVHSTLSLNKVNTWGLVYEWTGSDASLKPLLLAAHQGIKQGLSASKTMTY